MNKIISLFMTLCVVTSFSINVSAENDSIKVYVDEEQIAFDVEPEIINGRTMVPMRKIFEYFGVDVNWNQYDKSIYAGTGFLDIRMQIDNNEMRINDERITLESPPVIVDGRTLVPLRAVAEAFSSEVEWMGDTKTIKITTPYPKNVYRLGEFDKYHISTSNGEFEYFDFQIENELLTITGYTQDADMISVALKFDEGPLENITSVKPNEKFELMVDLSKRNISNETNINIYTKKQQDDMFWSYIYKTLFIEKNNEDYSFKKPLVWENNKEYMSKWINPIVYINTDIDEEIIRLSNDICEGINDDYDKILLIHDWVADNIYYNYDYYYNRNSVEIVYDAAGVYESKRSVCEGYANLMQALINAQGIPCRKVRGYSLGLGSSLKYWTAETAAAENSNHAWNQAYVDNRWINIDATWDSGNKYENGQFLYEGIQNHMYFDISDVFFSYNHKYIG